MDNITLNGFEVFEELMPGASVKNKPVVSPTNEEEEETKIDLEGVGEELSEEELNNIRKNTKTETEEEKEEELEEEDKEVKSKKEETEESTDETTIVTGFFDSLSEKLGWDDIEDDDKPKTVEDLIDYFNDVIEENSVPQYASEEVEQLDKFVKNGGNLRDYFSIDTEVDLDDIDLEDESNQKLVLKEFLKEKGFNTKQIEKKLTKYEEAGILEDES
jgi:DNA-binding transcriptional MerR regulator